jgi:predicted GNAT family acetyltransferase
MHPLDNIIWKALTTRQAEFAESFDQARRFVPEVSPLAAFREPTPVGHESLAGLVDAGETIGLFLEAPYQPQAGWSFLAGAPMPEMVYERDGVPVQRSSSVPEILELGDADSPDMMALTALTKPGPFGKRTHELGTYLGIRLDGKLVAMTGERLKIPGYTEVSAVCTHPEFQGRGYAGALMSILMRKIAQRGETPLLHVRPENASAIRLYEKLGFRTRRSLYFAVLRSA